MVHLPADCIGRAQLPGRRDPCNVPLHKISDAAHAAHLGIPLSGARREQVAQVRAAGVAPVVVAPPGVVPRGVRALDGIIDEQRLGPDENRTAARPDSAVRPAGGLPSGGRSAVLRGPERCPPGAGQRSPGPLHPFLENLADLGSCPARISLSLESPVRRSVSRYVIEILFRI